MFEKLCARLVRSPFFMSIDQIKQLTSYQLRRIFFREDSKREDESLEAMVALTRISK